MSSHRAPPLPALSFDSSPPPPPPPKPSRTGIRSSSNTPHNAHPNLAPPPPPPPPTDARRENTHEASQQAVPPDASEHWLPEILLDKPTSVLSPLLHAPALLTALSSTHPALYPSPLPTHLAATATLAEHVERAHERLLAQRHATQQQLLGQHGRERAWREQQQRMDAVLEPWSAKALYRRLGAAERDAEDASRVAEEGFLDGGVGERGEGKATERELAEFCRRYREARGVVWRRREWRERWDEGRVGGWR